MSGPSFLTAGSKEIGEPAHAADKVEVATSPEIRPHQLATGDILR